MLSTLIYSFLQIAAEVAAPLARTEEIVLLGGSDTTSGEITRLVGQVPPAVQALTGVDLSKVCSRGHWPASDLYTNNALYRNYHVFDRTGANFKT